FLAYLEPSNSAPTAGFVTLPIAFRGSTSTTKRRDGTLYPAIRCLAQERSSSSSSTHPACNTTQAATRSPHSSSGTPSTAHSAIDGCSRRASSISSAESLCPPDLMISTLVRPRILYTPFSTTDISPVRNHPSRNAFLVASGFPQYSLNTLGPRT